MSTVIRVQDINKIVLDLLVKYPGTCLAGGALAAQFSSNVVRDYDVFFPGKSTENLDAASQFVAEAGDYHVASDTQNAVTLVHDDVLKNRTVQLIKKKFDTQQDVVNSFDFTCVRFALWFDGEKFCEIATKNSIEVASRKELICSGNTYNAAQTLRRAFRYVGNKGYSIGNDAIGSLVYMVHEQAIAEGVEIHQLFSLKKYHIDY